MKICEKCKQEFKTRPVIDGVRRNLHNRKFCLVCSPFGHHNTTKLILNRPFSTIGNLSSQEFLDIVKVSTSRSDLFFKLKLRKSGAAFKILNRRIQEENVDVSHFRMGCIHGENEKWSDDAVYCKNSNYRAIRARALRDNFMPYKCGICGIDPTWNNSPLTLELDHINGDRYDHRKENLRWTCPNCHSQTKTYGMKKRS